MTYYDYYIGVPVIIEMTPVPPSPPDGEGSKFSLPVHAQGTIVQKIITLLDQHPPPLKTILQDHIMIE
jgi:hypothetical protein